MKSIREAFGFVWDTRWMWLAMIVILSLIFYARQEVKAQAPQSIPPHEIAQMKINGIPVFVWKVVHFGCEIFIVSSSSEANTMIGNQTAVATGRGCK